MVISKPAVDPDGLYTQQQASEALGVDRHTTRRYCKQGILRFYPRRAGGAKVTTGSEIIKCWGIKGRKL